MAESTRGFWGPHPKYAILLVSAVLSVIAWVAIQNPDPVANPTAQQITVMKPIDGITVGAPQMPIEARYGVPTERTLHLWPEHERSK